MTAASGFNLAMRSRSSRGVAVALGDENGVGAGEVRRRLAQRAAREQMLVAERLLAVNQHHVVPAAAQIPVLKAVVEQQRVAAEFFNRVTPALHAVLVHQHDDVLEIRREHVRFVAGHFGIEQQRFAVGDDARRRLVFAQQDFVQQPTVERRRFGTVAAREDGDVAAGVAQFAREFFHDRRFAGAADGEVADGDDLHAERLVAQDADVVKPAAHLDGDLEQFRTAEQKSARQLRLEIVAFLENDFEDKGFQAFQPRHGIFRASRVNVPSRGAGGKNWRHFNPLALVIENKNRGRGRERGRKSESHLRDLVLQRDLKFLHVGGGRFVALFGGHDAEPARSGPDTSRRSGRR